MPKPLVYELTDKGYKDNGLIDRIIFVYPSSQEISDWQDEENAFTTFDKYSSMWENIINKVMSLPFIVNEDGEIVPDILDFSSEAKAYFTNWRNDAIHAVNQIQDDGLVDSEERQREAERQPAFNVPYHGGRRD